MSDPETVDSETAETNSVDSEAAANAPADGGAGEPLVPEFQQLDNKRPATQGKFDLNRFGGVQVVLTVELGRTEMTIQELMSLCEGDVLELNRAISAPVELVSQGVAMGNGEVVVIEDQFAVRVKEIYQS